MKKRTYIKPILSGEEFVPQAYCKNCSAEDNKKWVYSFVCDAGTPNKWHTVYLETNGTEGCQTGRGGDEYQSSRYHPCGASHVVETNEELTDANLNAIFPKGYILINDKWENCRVWTANGTNTHVTTAIDADDFQLAKS